MPAFGVNEARNAERAWVNSSYAAQSRQAEKDAAAEDGATARENAPVSPASRQGQEGARQSVRTSSPRQRASGESSSRSNVSRSNTQAQARRGEVRQSTTQQPSSRNTEPASRSSGPRGGDFRALKAQAMGSAEQEAGRLAQAEQRRFKQGKPSERVRLEARRVVQDMADLQGWDSDTLKAWEKKALADPFDVKKYWAVEYRKARQKLAADAGQGLEEVMKACPDQAVYILVAADHKRRKIKRVPLDADDAILHGLLLESVPRAATPFHEKPKSATPEASAAEPKPGEEKGTGVEAKKRDTDVVENTQRRVSSLESESAAPPSNQTQSSQPQKPVVKAPSRFAR